MAQWVFWEWLGFSCLWLAAFISAADTGLKMAPDFRNHLKWLVDRRLWAFAPFILMVIATPVLVLQAFGFFHSNSKETSVIESGETPLKDSNARLDISKWEQFLSPKKQYLVNAHVINAGKSTASKWSHDASTANAPGRLDDDLIDALFIVLKSKMNKSSAGTASEIPPGENDIWFTIPDNLSGPQLDDATIARLQSGQMFSYIILLMRYADTTLAPGQWIYTEKCVYYAGSILHYCENGHNRSYVSR